MRRHLLALLVLWHATAMAMSALPMPGVGLQRSYWAEPTVQAEFRTWARMLGTDPLRLQDQLFELATGVQAVVDTLNRPFRPWLKLTNTRQSWQMFVAPHRFPTRLQLRGRAEGGEWEVLFEEDRGGAGWRAERFATERMRASVFAWGWPQARKRWASACAGFARELFEERGELVEVQCRFAKVESPSAAEVRAGVVPEEEWVLSRTQRRAELAP